MILEVVTPEKVAYRETIDAVVVPTIDGYIAVWHNHAPLITALDTGVLWYRDESGNRNPHYSFAINQGFLEVLDNKVTVFTETAERGDELDLERALAAKRRAEERLKLDKGNVDHDRARIALAKALARIRAGGQNG